MKQEITPVWARPPGSGSSDTIASRHWPIALALLVLATFVIRARYFGNPLIDVDEEYYLLVGDRMLHGAVPYLDIWDRKSPGLFVLYAAIRLLGGEGIVQYQIVAAAFVAATAVTIALIARRISTPGAALIAGLAYVPALAMSGGQGGQTPVFYNLPMAVAAWLIVGLIASGADVARIQRRGALAMLLVGIAMQIKYSALFEGVYFGCTLIWLSWRARPRQPALLLDMTLWAMLALVPTAIAYGWYASIGQAQAFLFANFTSIGQREEIAFGHQYHDLKRILVRMLVFVVPIVVGEWLLRDDRRIGWREDGGARVHTFVLGWLAAAVIGFAAFGTFFNHYALPLLVPLAIASAPTFTIARRHIGPVMAAIVLLALFIAYPLDADKYERRRGDARWAQAIVAQITPRLHGGCLYVFYGEPILYHLTHSCLPTRWAFPFHLSLQREAPALGVDAVAEAQRIMASRPPVVVDRLSDDDEVNYPIQAMVRADLRRDYRLVWSAKHPDGPEADTDQVWELKPELRPKPAPPSA